MAENRFRPGDIVQHFKREMLSEEEKGGLFAKAVINGTAAPVTGIFGLTLAGLITEDICRKAWEEEKHRETPAK